VSTFGKSVLFYVSVFYRSPMYDVKNQTLNKRHIARQISQIFFNMADYEDFTIWI
jgi:hypothetical protein